MSIVGYMYWITLVHTVSLSVCHSVFFSVHETTNRVYILCTSYFLIIFEGV